MTEWPSTRARRVLAALVIATLAAILGIAILAPSALAQNASAQPTPTPSGQLVVEGETVIFDEARREVEATGAVRLRYRGIEIRADYVLFDLNREVMTATGNVTLIDARGRELLGESLVYDVRLGLADLQGAQTVVDGVYLRSERIQATERRVTATEAMATTCDPSRPAYRITASQIEVTPGDTLVARRASLWVGSVRVLSLPVLTISLRRDGEGGGIARSLPRVGYNSVDGAWIDYLYGYQLGGLEGGLYLKYGSLTRLIARNALRYQSPGYAVELTVGRNQDVEMRLFDQAEVTVFTPRFQLGASSVYLRVGAGTGWFQEATTGLATSRTFGDVSLDVPATSLGSSTLSAAFTYRHAWYGTGAVQGVVRGNASLVRPFNPRTSLTVGYRILEVGNGTPFLFDEVLVNDRVHEVTAVVNRSGIALGARQIELYGGAAYSLRDATTSVLAGVIAPDPKGLSLSLGLRYNLNLAELTVTLDSGVQITPSARFSVAAEYNARTQAFTDFDYTLKVRFCDCLEAMLTYRQVRQEIWFQVGLSPESRIQPIRH